MESLDSYEVNRQRNMPSNRIAKRDQSNYDVTGSMAESNAQGSALASDEND